MNVPAVEQPASPAPLNERSFRLFSYLRELTSLNLTRVTDINRYDRVVWLADVPENSACFSILNGPKLDGDDSTWVEVKKRAEPRLAVPPNACEGWYIQAHLKSDTSPPALLDRILLKTDVLSTESPQFVTLAERPSVARAWQAYIESEWRPWADEHKEWRKHHEFYSSLFTIEQQVKRLGEAYELFLGIGLLSWTTPTGERIQRHLVAARALLSFDTFTGTISLRAAAEGAKPTLEYDMLDPESRPIPNVIKVCEAMISECGEDLWSEKLQAPLRSWVNAMSDLGVFSEANRRPDTLAQHPVVTLAPALVLRPRTRRSLITFLQGIANRLKDMAPPDIPFGVRRLVEIVGESNAPFESDSPRQDKRSAPSQVGEIYFPLLSNDEQRQIVQRLRSNRGVLVQGPPGTGKSQTIANLICHLLAEGKRILITSQTERALKVLQSKLPEELQALCVTVLGADETALKNMERSVLGINERQTNWEASKNTEHVRRLEQELASAREAKTKAETRLRCLRETGFQKFSIAANAYHGTAGVIAQRLEAERETLAWIEDNIPESCESPISDSEFLALHGTLVELPLARRRECTQSVVIPSAISSVEEFVTSLRGEREAQAKLDEYCGIHTKGNGKQFSQWTASERRNLRAQIEAIHSELSAIRQKAPEWTLRVLSDSLAGRPKPWQDLLTAMEGDFAKIREKMNRAYDRELHIPSRDKTILRADAEALLEHLQQGKGLGWGPFRAKCVKQALYIVREVRVNGRACDTPVIVAELVEHLHVERTIELMWTHCSAHTTRIHGGIRAQLSELEQFVLSLNQAATLVRSIEEVRTALRAHRGVVEPTWIDSASISSFLDEIDAAEARNQLTESQAAFRKALVQLETVAAAPYAHTSVMLMHDAVTTRSADEYGKAHELAVSLLRDRELWSKASSIATRLRKSAPYLMAALEATPSDPKWTTRIKLFGAAWAYARANSWLVAFIGDMDEAAAESEVRRAETKISQALEALATAHAWRHCLSRLTEGQRQHMIAWKDAIKRIGKGTGVRAHLHRQHAREHMEECRSAIPAWIMPFYRIAETTSDTPEPYDVVIVDEASQSGPEACALMYLAKRCIIVGDDKQISPEAVGIERVQVDQLREQYLSDIPHNDSFGVESSLFSQAQIRFGGRIRLREHFRCMPEIIRFSNDLCYQDEPLLPLRQYSANRLKPIAVRHIAAGLREGEGARTRNRTEAMALVDQIVACLKDPAYAGKSMGVISLLGESQAELIRELAVSRIEPKDIEERELTFGDAYAFQGDERDIIFLSMVAAPNVRNATLANNKAEQRFNVATSRARDQIWLFHSITLEDLTTTDVRYRLLSYYLNPDEPPPFDPDWTKCDSKFEEIVGKVIFQKGYRIIPQYEPFGKGGKRLDFVIEGKQARLAVECDGDAFHTAPEDVHNDLVRQRQLERCGWSFWRISDSRYYWDRTKSLEPLWETLAKLGIEPRKESEPEPSAPIVPIVEPVAIPPPTPRAEVAAPKMERPIIVPRESGVVPAVQEKISFPRQADLPFRSRPELEPLEKFILDLLDSARKMETNALTLETIRRLGLGADGRRNIELALRRLEEKGLVKCGVNYVERQFATGFKPLL